MKNRLNDENYNNQGCLMKVVKYNGGDDIIIEFQDEYKAKVHTSYHAFRNGKVKNPYYPTAYGVGVVGAKYPISINRKNTKEYGTWRDMLRRCFDEKYKENHPTYNNVTCCNEWLLYENFYEWLHSQKNFEKWLNEEQWSIDKDIVIKNNKIYSPETCVLVPHNINSLFTKGYANRGNSPIGIKEYKGKYIAECRNPYLGNKNKYLGYYLTSEQAFEAYKTYKENLIKQIAQMEFFNGNITEKCYNAMMNYIVEITD